MWFQKGKCCHAFFLLFVFYAQNLKGEETNEPVAETASQQAAELQGNEPSEATSPEIPTGDYETGVYCVCMLHFI